MAKSTEKTLKKLKKQDKELEKLPSMDKEKRVFRRGESILKRMSRSQKVNIDYRKLANSRKSVLQNIRKSRKSVKSRRTRKAR